jgi:2-iminobutanoate/2-iminopropanoate deaminase
MATKRRIQTPNAPDAVGPYSQGIVINGMVFTAGQVGMNPQTKQLAEGVQAQTQQALLNVEAILHAVGASLKDVIKTTVFLQHMDDFAAMNEIYQQIFDAQQAPYPARSAVEVARLPLGALVEVEAVATLDELLR